MPFHTKHDLFMEIQTSIFWLRNLSRPAAEEFLKTTPLDGRNFALLRLKSQNSGDGYEFVISTIQTINNGQQQQRKFNHYSYKIGQNPSTATDRPNECYIQADNATAEKHYSLEELIVQNPVFCFLTKNDYQNYQNYLQQQQVTNTPPQLR